METGGKDALSLLYFHIELDTHEPILAEGLAVESDQRDNLHAFDNADEYIRLYGYIRPHTASYGVVRPF